ncbi:ABC transporter ATP-binding protein [Clostridiaceae bacterium JG1575]|nr:ABC transporter ATP-binding protein [Clostridiaceae bacterium JG1575]
MTLLDVCSLKKIYSHRFSSQKTVALENITFQVSSGEFIAIMGESGSGKTTLLNLISTLDTPSAGEIRLNGQNLSAIKDKEKSAFRRERMGFVFQDFNLLDTFNVKDNVLLPLVLSRTSIQEMEERLKPILQELGLSSLVLKYPYELSGGQKQRVAVARALITHPDIILADEPTGALDSKSSSELLDLLERLNQRGETILMVTHSALAASHAARVIFIRDGVILQDLARGAMDRGTFRDYINSALARSTQRGA